MGTAFSVTYATIFMIWLETPIVQEFELFIKAYKRYIGDIFLAWTGPPAELQRFKSRFATADKNISLEWQNNDINHDQKVDYLDLCITVSQQPTGKAITLGVFHKPGNSYAYLPYGSFPARHTFKARLKAEVVRLLTHSCNANQWLYECRTFYEHLRARGYPTKAIQEAFHNVCWNDRRRYLYKPPNPSPANEQFFTNYKGCVLSVDNAPGIEMLKSKLNLSLHAIQQDLEGHADIFPSKAFLSIRGAMPLGFYLKR
mmetsp:Transcript_17042/g.46744  ORF Transcript_17042/g.46744 Transcript_17042/m.46744 type:complete len:257 (+) Transcript_17042:1173-1943(+)